MDLLTGTENVELVAMADVFEDHLEGSLKRLRDPKYIARHAGILVERDGKPHEMTKEDLAAEIAQRVTVAPDHHFVGFDAYQKLINSDVDIVMLTTPPGYRPMHFEAAIEAKKHVFTEKPIATDPVGVRRFLAAAKKAEEQKLTVMSGAQRHEDRPYVETVQKIHDGAIGDVVALYANYLSGPVMHADARDPKWGDMEWEHRNWYSFVWLCGDQIVEQHYPRHRLHQLGDGHASGARGGVRRRGVAPAPGALRQHLRSHDVGFHVSERRPPEQRLPPVSAQPESRHLHERERRPGGGHQGPHRTARIWARPGISAYVQEHINMVKSIRGDGPYINQAKRSRRAR